MSVRSRRSLRLYLLGAAALTFAYFLVPPFRGNGFVFNLIGLSSAMAIVGGARLHRPAHPLVWYLLAAGQVAFVLGDVVYYGYATIRNAEVPFPSLGDVFYLATYPLLIVAFVLLVGRRNPGRDRSSLLDALIISTGLGLLSWVFLMVPYARDASLSALEKEVSIAYPLMDVLLFAVTVRLVVDRGGRPPAFYLLGAGLLCLTLTDVVYGLVELTGTYEQGALLDMGWIAYYVLWGAAALHPSMRTLSEPGAPRPVGLSRLRLAMLSAASLIAPGIEIALARGQGELLVVGGTAAVLFLLVVARMAELIREQESATGRERVLREAGSALVAARDLRSIFQASFSAVQTLAGRGCEARLWLSSEPGTALLPAGAPPGAAAGLALDDLSEPVRSELVRGVCAELDSSDDSIRSVLGVGPETVVLLIPLRVRGDVGALVALTSTGPLPLPVRAGLDALDSQVALALDAAALAEDLHTRRSEARFQSLVQHSSDIITVVDRASSIRYVSPSVGSVLGQSPESLMGERLVDHAHPDDRPVLAGFLQRDQGEGAPAGASEVLEFRWRHRDGTWVDVEAVATDLLDDPNVGGIVLNARNVTERKRVEAAMEAARDAALEASRLKSAFLTNMSHEIRTPMNAVIGMAGLLLDTDLDPVQADYARTVRSSAETLLDIITDILDFSKVEAGKLRLESVEFDPRVVVEEVADMLTLRAGEKSIELSALVRADVPFRLRGDPGRIRQILVNLTGNAVKFTDHGEVTVRAAMEESTDQQAIVRFEIADTGIGIAGDKQDRLFEAFYQVDASDARRYGGSGLGLAISRQLVELMGGELGFRSIAGSGSTFWFTVPFGWPGGPADALPAQPYLDGLKVLVVDDKAANRAVLADHLSSWRMRPGEAEDGLGALAALRTAADRREPYDLAIVDMQMPGMDGLALAAAIQAEPALASTRMVLVASPGRRGDAEAARAAGVAGYVTRPVRSSHLFDCLATVMDKAPEGPGHEPVTGHGEAETPSPRNARVLVVEDNAVNQKVAVMMLDRLGYRADVAADGSEAVTAIGHVPYAAVLMDCQMPGMDGYSATSEIRKLEAAGMHTPIIAMTAGAMEGDRERCLAAGMDDYLSKPVRPEELAAVLERWISAGPHAPDPAEKPTPIL